MSLIHLRNCILYLFICILFVIFRLYHNCSDFYMFGWGHWIFMFIIRICIPFYIYFAYCCSYILYVRNFIAWLKLQIEHIVYIGERFSHWTMHYKLIELVSEHSWSEIIHRSSGALYIILYMEDFPLQIWFEMWIS